MNDQIRAILWAQFRTIRNHLPRSGWGTILTALLSTIWYGLFAAIAASIALKIPGVPVATLQLVLPLGLLVVLLFWQIVPVMTLSSGWSLELSKLLVYPIRQSALFGVEVLLRLTTAPEMIIVLLGALVGLARHPEIPAAAAFWLLLYLPFNLLLSLAIREWLLRMFRRKRLRELLIVAIVIVTVLPNLLVNTSLGPKLKPVFISVGTGQGTPWHELSVLALGQFSFQALAIWIISLAVVYILATRQFAKMLDMDRAAAFESAARGGHGTRRSRFEWLLNLPNRLFDDPVAALLEKEMRVLSRSPRFRVIFGMACFFSALVFFPLAFGRQRSTFMEGNYLPVINTYGLLILGEVLLWNVFGFDRKAAQIYFVAPVPFETVLRAKNLAALAAIVLMTLFTTTLGYALHAHITPAGVLGALFLTLILTLFLLACGNLTSVIIPRAIDPNQAFRNQNAGKATLWLLVCFMVMAIPVGLAFLAKWAFNSDSAFLAILCVDLIVGLIVYKVATESAVARVESGREQFLDALSKGKELVGQ
jgi:ABC-2 type transport system permease protein